MLCGVTATLGSNPSATATAARPHWGRAVLLCLPDLWARSLGVPVGGGPPARRPRRVLMLVAPLVFRAPEGPAAREARRPHFVRRRASKPARALRSLRRPPHQWGRVADVARCVGLLFGQAPPPSSGTAAWSLYSLWASRWSRVLSFWGCSGACCYKRRQSKVFFVWISAPLLQTSSI